MYIPPDSQHSERAVLHAQCQVDAVRTHCCTADGLLHVTACYQSMVYQAPYPTILKKAKLNNVKYVLLFLSLQISIMIFKFKDSINFVPDRSVITASYSQRFGRVHRQGPELAFTVALHDEERLGAVMHHHLKNLAVLRAN